MRECNIKKTKKPYFLSICIYRSAFEYFDLIAKGRSIFLFLRPFECDSSGLGSCVELLAIQSMIYTKARTSINVDATDIMSSLFEMQIKN